MLYIHCTCIMYMLLLAKSITSLSVYTYMYIHLNSHHACIAARATSSFYIRHTKVNNITITFRDYSATYIHHNVVQTCCESIICIFPGCYI